jgi:Peptidase C13 family
VSGRVRARVAAIRVMLAGSMVAALVACALPTAAAGDPPALDRDAIYRAQPLLLADEIEALAPQRPGAPDLYFIGFAGFAGLDVFMKEVETVRRLFDERFGTRERSLLLVNNPRTVDALPLASAGNLRLALDAVAGKMNLDKDVLFLFLTSHGSKSELAVSFPPLGLEDLSPEELRRMLDGAGIKWRVIVISACYSGSFIDALRDRRTLIMTAASSEHTSFGCGNENDWTYFGDAYFNQALRHQSSFIAAFEEARRLIAAREHHEELTPSEPQISVGAAIKQKLGELGH